MKGLRLRGMSPPEKKRKSVGRIWLELGLYQTENRPSHKRKAGGRPSRREKILGISYLRKRWEATHPQSLVVGTIRGG